MKKLLTSILLVCSISCLGQLIIGRQSVDQFPINSIGSAKAYGLVWLPPTYPNTIRTYPLIIFCHGWGDGGTTANDLSNLLKPGFIPTQIANGWNGQAFNLTKNLPDTFIVISPQGPSYPYVYGNGLKWIVLDIFNRYRVDRNQVYITGLSAGGAATWSIAGSFDSLFIKNFAAIAPVATVGLDPDFVRGLTESDQESQFKYLIPAYGVKLWQTVGGNDAQISNVTRYHDSAQRLVPIPRAKMTVITGADHDATTWGKIYDPNFRPKASYYGLIGGGYTLVPNDNGSPVRGSGITQDSLSLYEWFLKWTRDSLNNFSVTAGPDKTITLPTNSVQLVGSATSQKGRNITGYVWNKVSGPASFTITPPNQSTTTVSNLVQGTYTFRLTATDNTGAQLSDDVIVTVNAQPISTDNQPPTDIVNSPATIVLPQSSFDLKSTQFDPEGFLRNSEWSKVWLSGMTIQRWAAIGSSTLANTGPANVDSCIIPRTQKKYKAEGVIDSIVNRARGSTNVYQGVSSTGFISPGSHTASPITDSNVTAIIHLIPKPSVCFVGYPGNLYDSIGGLSTPEILAAHQNIFDSLIFNGIIPIILGPQPRAELGVLTAIKLANLNVLMKSQFGPYYIDTWDAVVIPGTNSIQPQYNAGDDVHMSSNGHREVAHLIWALNPEKFIVNSSTTIQNPTAQNTTVTGFGPGVHKFQNAVWDQYGLAASAITSVTVSGTPTNQSPIANAGQDRNLTLPINYDTLNGSASSDPDGTIASYLWTKFSGGTATITNPTSAVTSVSGLSEGTYIFQLTVTDNGGYANTDNIIIKVNKALGCNGIRRVIDWVGNHRSIHGAQFTYNPGDTFVFVSTGVKMEYIFMDSVYGTSGCPITTINQGPDPIEFINGIQFISCRYININGGGNPNIHYGFKMRDTLINFDTGIGAGDGISITGKSRNIDVQRVDITHKRYGFLIQNRPNCDTTINQYIMDSISIHDCNVHYTGSEGVYAGFTDPGNVLSPVTCGGIDYYYKPSRLGNIQIYGSNFDSTGRAGIQLSNAMIGTSEIYNNRVHNNGMQLNVEQGNGIVLGGYTVANVHDNDVDSTYTDGIRSLGYKNIRIENNIVKHAGVLFTHTNFTVQPVFVSTYKPITPLTVPRDSLYATIKNNQLGISFSGQEIYLADDNGTFSYFNYVCGNIRVGDGPAVIKYDNAAADPPNNHPIHFFTTGCAAVVNQPPTANAGNNQVITLPTNSVLVTGSGNDLDGSVVSYVWSKVSGPSTYTINNPSNAQTTISSLVAGTYQFRLLVTDNLGATGDDTVQVLVNPAPNIKPIANAGSNQVITLPASSVTLTGSGTDADGTISSYLWSRATGPGQYTIVSPTSNVTVVNGLVAGTYQFKLVVTDNSGGKDSSTVQVKVNQPPIADAGINQTITLPTSSIALTGGGSDADGTIVSYSWAKTSGGAGTITSPSSQSTTVTGLVAGTYNFTLTVTDDNGATATNTMIAIVNASPPPNQSPIANGGGDKTITLPINQTTLNGSGTDADGTIASYSWTKISGPTNYTLVSPSSAATIAKDMDTGTYVFRLRVTDNLGATGDDFVTVRVLKAPVVVPGSNRLILYRRRGFKYQ